ncbi:hypothetical protein [Streptomyces prasinus]|uniref:hypothetical protein n=1 Tax=Streptomyces prasinus TaxID=67345 RepID=UPI00368BBF36
MPDREEAERRAVELLAGENRIWGMSSRVRIVSENCFTAEGQLIAPYGHVDYLDHGREDMQLGGNLPVALDLTTGACRFIDWEEADDFMARDLL